MFFRKPLPCLARRLRFYYYAITAARETCHNIEDTRIDQGCGGHYMREGSSGGL